MTIDPNSTLLYAPQARLVDLETGAVVGATKATAQGAAIVSPDIVSAKVTLTNTGIGQLQVTLNNQRFVDGQPIWPPWKYNDFSKQRHDAGASTDGLASIVFGKLLRLDLRYGDTRWVKMIVAQVNDLQFSFPASGGSQLQVIGEDILCRTKVKPREDKNYQNKQEEEIVQEIWNAVFTQAPSRPTFQILDGAREDEGRTQPLRTLRHQKSTTYFQFMQEMAERLDYEMFMQFKNELVAPPSNQLNASLGSAVQVSDELEVWFQPARSKYPPQGEIQDGLDPGTRASAPEYVTYELWWGRNLLEFSPKFKVFDMPTRAEANGTNHGAQARADAALTDGEITSLLRAELPVSPEYAGVQPINAIEARTDFFQDAGDGAQSGETAPGSNLDRPRLKLKAAAQFMKKVREFMTAEGQVIGLPRLRAGNYVHIVGLRPPFDGYYYVTKTVHTLDSSGYRTQFSVRRPGMLPPQQYLTKPSAEQARGAATPTIGGGV
jgi:uncharacterized protein